MPQLFRSWQQKKWGDRWYRLREGRIAGVCIVTTPRFLDDRKINCVRRRKGQVNMLLLLWSNTVSHGIFGFWLNTPIFKIDVFLEVQIRSIVVLKYSRRVEFPFFLDIIVVLPPTCWQVISPKISRPKYNRFLFCVYFYNLYIHFNNFDILLLKYRCLLNHRINSGFKDQDQF
jgi:hypothetical protein